MLSPADLGLLRELLLLLDGGAVQLLDVRQLLLLQHQGVLGPVEVAVGSIQAGFLKGEWKSKCTSTAKGRSDCHEFRDEIFNLFCHRLLAAFFKNKFRFRGKGPQRRRKC